MAAAAAAVVVLAGCGGGSDKPDAKPSASTSKSAPAVAPRDALETYEQETASGCTDADDCQAFMTRKLAAADKVREAMQVKDASLYAVPIGYVDEADRQADHYGRENLSARGNMLAVSLPLQRMVAWFREHPEG
ncbi:hypothetical protein HZZ00_37465 (plasmid) [Streptomyces sp. NEAU-sy36]|uniref:hypothetical protein n=1 Tax=unclassified Streptomyces TaxID=2593676 RepID=UPI0015D5CB91|nr:MULTISPECIES: hypothetical protein [unclassified Streptomyces]QLJ06726.1 hypothetical protein HZZ00_37465 [Streptomyces sp. NEAU-sy36]